MRPLLNTQVWHHEQGGHGLSAGGAQGWTTAGEWDCPTGLRYSHHQHQSASLPSLWCWPWTWTGVLPLQWLWTCTPYWKCKCIMSQLSSGNTQSMQKWKLCQWVEWFCSWDCLTPDSPWYQPPCSSTARQMWRNMKQVFSNIQCILSILATNFLPKGFYLFSQKN